MTNKKISALTAATTPLAGTEVLPIVQAGATVKVAVSDLTAGRAITATSINKMVVTTPATSSTLTIADGKTLTANNSLTFAGTDATTMTFPTTSATVARTDAANSFTGNQTLSTGNLIVSNGKGIDFSATPGTGTSELFADYEEGTWTPTDNSGAGLTFTTAAGYYTKVGRLVVATFRIIFPVTANVSASSFGGLPYVSKNGGNQEQQGGGMRFTNSSLTFNFANGQGTSTFQPLLNNGNAIANSLFSTFIIDGMIVYQTA